MASIPIPFDEKTRIEKLKSRSPPKVPKDVVEKKETEDELWVFEPNESDKAPLNTTSEKK